MVGGGALIWHEGRGALSGRCKGWQSADSEASRSKKSKKGVRCGRCTGDEKEGRRGRKRRYTPRPSPPPPDCPPHALTGFIEQDADAAVVGRVSSNVDVAHLHTRSRG